MLSDSVLFRATRDSARLGVLSDSRLGRLGASANPDSDCQVAAFKFGMTGSADAADPEACSGLATVGLFNRLGSQRPA